MFFNLYFINFFQNIVLALQKGQFSSRSCQFSAVRILGAYSPKQCRNFWSLEMSEFLKPLCRTDWSTPIIAAPSVPSSLSRDSSCWALCSLPACLGCDPYSPKYMSAYSDQERAFNRCPFTSGRSACVPLQRVDSVRKRVIYWKLQIVSDYFGWGHDRTAKSALKNFSF